MGAGERAVEEDELVDAELVEGVAGGARGAAGAEDERAADGASGEAGADLGKGVSGKEKVTKMR